MPGWIGWLPLGLMGLAGAEPPVLQIVRSGQDAITVSVVGGKVEGGWILQHTYNGSNWWDLGAMDGKPVQYAVSSAPTATRLFRAAKKPPATRQEALTQARECWAAGGLMKYHTALGYPLFFSRDWHLTQVDGPGERFWISGFRTLKGP